MYLVIASGPLSPGLFLSPFVSRYEVGQTLPFVATLTMNIIAALILLFSKEPVRANKESSAKKIIGKSFNPI